MKKILPLFSYILHPIFIPLLGTFFYVKLGANYFTIGQYLLLFLQIFIVTVLLPTFFFSFLKALGKINSVMLPDVSQRKVPLLLQITLLTILIERGITIDRFPILYFFFLSGIISTFLAFLFLFANIKASIHMIGISTLTVFIIGLSIKYQINTINLVAFFILLNGIVASSRLVMKAHTSKELRIGFLCGVLPQSALLYFWL